MKKRDSVDAFDSEAPKQEDGLSTKCSLRRFFPCFRVALLFGLQVMLSGICWNLALLFYHRLLETYEVARWDTNPCM